MQNDVALRPLFFITKRRAFMTYVDGFVVAVQTSNRETYRKHAEAAAVVFKEIGALNVVVFA
jgi:hypothetical protein